MRAWVVALEQKSALGGTDPPPTPGQLLALEDLWVQVSGGFPVV